jgi:hypothetical protein
MSEDGSYNLRRSLQYVPQKPLFLQKILTGEASRQEQQDREREGREPDRADEEPAIVLGSGSSPPRDTLIPSSELATLDDFDTDTKAIEEMLQSDDHPTGNAKKKARTRPEQKQLSKLKSDIRLLSFIDDDDDE